MYGVTYDRRNSSEIREFKENVLHDHRGDIEKMCEEVFEIVVRAENRGDVLDKIGNGEELYGHILKCCKEYIENEGHCDDMSDEREDNLQNFIKYLMNKTEPENISERYRETFQNIISNDDGMELTYDEIDVLSTLFEPSKKLKNSIKDYNSSQDSNNRIDWPDFLKNVVNHLEITKDRKVPNPCAMILYHIYSNMID